MVRPDCIYNKDKNEIFRAATGLWPSKPVIGFHAYNQLVSFFYVKYDTILFFSKIDSLEIKVWKYMNGIIIVLDATWIFRVH